MPTPSTGWSEIIAPDEDARHQAFTEAIIEIQSRVNAKKGPGRAFHRKQIAALDGWLIVAGGLPDYAAQGLFAEPGQYEVVARLSNGGISVSPDAVPDIRGFAFSVRGIEGPGALGGTTDRQDFLFINQPAFGFKDSVDFAQIVEASRDGQLGMLRQLIGSDGVIAGPVRLAQQAAHIARPFTGFATAGFHSCAPIAWGPYAVEVHLKPRGARINPLAWRDYGRDIRERIGAGPLQWDIEVQFYTDDENTPIEDLRSPWKGPRVVVGQLVLDRIADAEEVETDHFDPWSALVEHRPLGEVMRARRAAYYPSVQNREA